MANRRYWDACNFLAVINGEVGRAETCREIMREAATGNLEIVTSALTIAEVVRPKACGGIQKERDALVDSFLDQRYIIVIDVGRVTMQRARGFHVSTVLRSETQSISPLRSSAGLRSSRRTTSRFTT